MACANRQASLMRLRNSSDLKVTYGIIFLALGLQAKELLFFLPVVVRAYTCDDEDSEEDGETLNPG